MYRTQSLLLRTNNMGHNPLSWLINAHNLDHNPFMFMIIHIWISVHDMGNNLFIRGSVIIIWQQSIYVWVSQSVHNSTDIMYLHFQLTL